MTTSTVVELIVVVVPFTVRFPVIVVFPVTVSPSSIVIKVESDDDKVVAAFTLSNGSQLGSSQGDTLFYF